MKSKRNRGWFMPALAFVALVAAAILAVQFNNAGDSGENPVAAARPQSGGTPNAGRDDAAGQPLVEALDESVTGSMTDSASGANDAVDAIRAVEAPAADLNLPELFAEQPGRGRHEVFEIQTVSPGVVPEHSRGTQPAAPSTLDINLSDDRGY